MDALTVRNKFHKPADPARVCDWTDDEFDREALSASRSDSRNTHTQQKGNRK